MHKSWVLSEGLIQNCESINLNFQFLEKEEQQWLENLRKYRRALLFQEKKILEKKMKFDLMIQSKKVG